MDSWDVALLGAGMMLRVAASPLILSCMELDNDSGRKIARPQMEKQLISTILMKAKSCHNKAKHCYDPCAQSTRTG